MEFSKEEIRLCREILKYERRLTDFCWDIKDNVVIRAPERHEDIPLWQIKNCLDWLEKRCHHSVFLSHDKGDEANWWAFFDEYHETQEFAEGKTPLEALLKCVLEILRKEKGCKKHA